MSNHMNNVNEENSYDQRLAAYMQKMAVYIQWCEMRRDEQALASELKAERAARAEKDAERIWNGFVNTLKGGPESPPPDSPKPIS